MTKPGGNLTGFSAYEFSTGGKWLDLLKEVVPGLARAAVMFNPDYFACHGMTPQPRLPA